jgi:4,5:9,10-diseco-3-hydroxy-5,9,17-trioxoandrosta-1(10),2-diene-4-oate hydrolase
MSQKLLDKTLRSVQAQLIASIDPAIISRTIKVGGKKIHYIVVGKGRPLLLIHGATLGWGQWYKNIYDLSKKHKVIAIDLPGSGLSSRVDFNAEHLEKLFVDTVAATMTSLNIKSYDVVGHSFGGWVGARLALKYPKRVKKLVLINPVGLSQDIPSPFHILSISSFIPKILHVLVLGKSHKKTEDFLKSVVTNPATQLSKFFINHFHAARLIQGTQSPFHLIASALHKGKLKKDYFILPDLEKISTKTLIVWGKQDKSMYFPSTLTKIKNPRLKLHVYNDTGHIPFIEKATHFNQLLLSFLQG